MRRLNFTTLAVPVRGGVLSLHYIIREIRRGKYFVVIRPADHHPKKATINEAVLSVISRLLPKNISIDSDVLWFEVRPNLPVALELIVDSNLSINPRCPRLEVNSEDPFWQVCMEWDLIEGSPRGGVTFRPISLSQFELARLTF